MNSFAELIEKRRSVRKFTDEPLQPFEVEQIVKAGLIAPSSKNCRPCQFLLVEDKNALKALSHCKSSGSAFLEHAAVAVVVMADPMISTAYVEDATIAATYVQLQAEDLGLGSCWIQVAGRETSDGYDAEQYVRDLLDIPLQLIVECIIAIGRKVDPLEPRKERNVQWEKVHIEKYTYESLE